MKEQGIDQWLQARCSAYLEQTTKNKISHKTKDLQRGNKASSHICSRNICVLQIRKKLKKLKRKIIRMYGPKKQFRSLRTSETDQILYEKNIVSPSCYLDMYIGNKVKRLKTL